MPYNQRYKIQKPFEDFKSYGDDPEKIILRVEKLNDLKAKMKLLKHYVEKKLPFTESVFLNTQLGCGWDKKLVPLPSLRKVKDVEKYVDENIDDILERIKLLYEKIDFFDFDLGFSTETEIKSRIKAVVEKPFSLLTKHEIIQTYNEVRGNGGRFPKGFYLYDDGYIATTLTRYYVKNVRKMSVEEARQKLENEDFKKDCLGGILSHCFGNSVKKALDCTFPPYSSDGHQKTSKKEMMEESELDTLLYKLFEKPKQKAS